MKFEFNNIRFSIVDIITLATTSGGRKYNIFYFINDSSDIYWINYYMDGSEISLFQNTEQIYYFCLYNGHSKSISLNNIGKPNHIYELAPFMDDNFFKKLKNKIRKAKIENLDI